MKRNEGGEIRPSREEREAGFSADPAASLAEVPLTRGRAIKLAGAALAASAFGLLWADEADARKKKKKKKPTITPNPVDFGQVQVGTPQTVPVTINNPGTEPVYVSPDLGNPNFSLAPGFDPSVPIAPGTSATVPVTFAPTTPGVQTGQVTLVDGSGNEVRTAPVAGEGVDVTTP